MSETTFPESLITEILSVDEVTMFLLEIPVRKIITNTRACTFSPRKYLTGDIFQPRKRTCTRKRKEALHFLITDSRKCAV